MFSEEYFEDGIKPNTLPSFWEALKDKIRLRWKSDSNLTSSYPQSVSEGSLRPINKYLHIDLIWNLVWGRRGPGWGVEIRASFYERTTFLWTNDVFFFWKKGFCSEKKTNNRRTKWTIQRNEKISFFLNELFKIVRTNDSFYWTNEFSEWFEKTIFFN